ncbi:MAG: hypothetical protein ABFD00_03150 [Chloroherpetonaceae bacterium]
MFEAIKEFKNTRFKDYSINVKIVYRRTFNYFFSSDMILEYEKIWQHLFNKILIQNWWFHRYFPIINPEDGTILFPEVLNLIQEIKKIGNTKVFRWNSPDQPQFHLNKAMKILNIPKHMSGVFRSIHTFRATAQY